MIRAFLMALLAISLASATGPATAGNPADCPMAAAGMADHQDMGCCAPECAPDCAIVCPGAVVPFDSGALPPVPTSRGPTSLRPTDVLPSLGPGATDPPPRTTLS